MPNKSSDMRDLTLPLRIWRGLTHLGNPLLGAHLKVRVRRGKEDPNRLGERQGKATLARPAGPLIWLHAASVGESLSVLPLIKRLLEQDDTIHILITTGTVTSAKLLEGKLPPRAQHQYIPFDRVNSVRRFLDYWHPDAGLWVESELWPTLIHESRARKIPLALINARMSEKSARGWTRLRRTAREMLACFDTILAQDSFSAARLRKLGACNVIDAGNLKLAADPLDADMGEFDELKAAIGTRPVWCAASTHHEERIIADAHAELRTTLPDVLTILAPRQPDRGDDVHDLLTDEGLTVARRSLGERITPETGVYLVDTIGDMGLVFRLASAAFMGRSLAPGGGSNPLEATRLDCAVISGQGTENFAEMYKALDARGGVRRVGDAHSLAAATKQLLTTETARREQIDAALTLVADAHEVLATTCDLALTMAARGTTNATA